VIQVVTASAMEPLVSYLIRKVDVRIVVILGYLLLIGSTAGASLAENMDQFIIFTGFVGSIGASMLFISSLLVLWEWYTPATRGVVSGVGFGLQLGLSSAVLMLQQLLVNPRLIRTSSPDAQIASNIQNMFYVIIGV
jgi:MFS family permease